MAYNPIFGSGTTAPPKPDNPNTSALDAIMALTPASPSPAPIARAPGTLGLGTATPSTVPNPNKSATSPATTLGPGTSPTSGPGSPGWAEGQAAGAANAAAAANRAGNTAAANANPAPGVTSPTGVTGTVTPSPTTTQAVQGEQWDLNKDGVMTQEESYARQKAAGAAFTGGDAVMFKGSQLNPYMAGVPGSNTYELGGRPTFAAELSGALQASANQAALGINQAGQAGQAAATQGAAALQQGGTALSNYGVAQGENLKALGQGLTSDGYGLAQQANAAQGRVAPTLDTAAQNADLAAAYGTATQLGSAGSSLLAAGQAAQGRAAPLLDTRAQNADLALSQGAAMQLGQTGDVMGQLGLQAGNRATPAANYGQAQSALGASLGTAGRLGTTADQVNAAALAAGQRGGIGADYGQSRSALDQLAALESGPGQSGAEALMRQGASQAAQQALMLAHSGRGFGASAQGTSEALRSNAAAMQGVENQAAQLRAQEYAQRQQRAASNLTTQAGMLSGQSQADQAAALQARTQNDQAQAALYGLGAQATTSQAGLQQAAAQQFGTQAAADQAAALQSRQLNDQSQNALLAGQAAAQQNQAALFQGQAQQLGQQAGLNQAAALQASQQNDAATAALSGLGAQALSNTAGLQQASAAQLGQQAQLNQAASLQTNQQNDAYSQAMNALGLQAKEGGVNAAATGAQLGMAGQESGLGIYGQGVNAALAGNQLAGQSAAQAAQLQQNALTQTGQLAQIQSALRQAQVDSMLTEYGIDQNVAINRQNSDNALLGAGLSTGGTVLAGAAMALSDIRGKKRIKPAHREELFLSPGDSLLQPKPQPSALDRLSELSGEELDAIPDPYGLSYRRPPGPPAPRRYVSNGPAEDPGDNGEYEVPEAYLSDRRREARSGMTAGLGAYMASRRPMVLSDEKEKTDLREAKGYSYEYKDPTRPGAAPGRHVGPMAQDLQKTSARDAVAKQPNGRLAVDTGRLSLRNTAAISQQQRDLDELKEMVAELGGAKKTPSEGVPMRWEQPGSGFRWEPSVATTVPRVPEGDLPERFRTYAAPPVRPGRTFTRAAVESALDAAALPVKAASRAADYFTGNDSAFSNISGKDAAESLEWLYDKSDPSSIRREEAFAEGAIPQAQKAGQFVGEYAGGAPLAALTGRVPAFSPILHAAAAGKKKPLVKPTTTGIRTEPETNEGMARVLGKPIPVDEAASLIGVYDKLGGDNPKLKVATGPDSVTVKYHHAGPGDHDFDTAIERTFTRTPDGLSVHHDLFTLPKSAQGKGVGKEILRNQIEKYDELGVKDISLEAAWQGRSVWPRMGFELQNPAELAPMKTQFAKYLRDRGVPFDQAEAVASAPKSIHELAVTVAPKPPRALSSQKAPNGTDFLNLWPKPIALKADLRGASGEQLRHYLGVTR